jgi:hypothetical protein
LRVEETFKTLGRERETVGRRPNVELMKLVAQYWLLGYSPKMIADAIARDTGTRYSPKYIAKKVWELKRKGLLGKASGGQLWEKVMADLEGARLRVIYLQDLARDLKLAPAVPAAVKEKLEKLAQELETVPQLLDEARSNLNHLMWLYSGVRVIRK